MKLFSDIASGLGKAIIFLTSVFTKTNSYADALSKAGPTVIAAVLAIVYDITKAFTAAEGAAVAASTGNIPVAFQLSQTTIGLIQKVAIDLHAGETATVAAWKALNLPALPAPPATPAT